jgi:nitrogenase molybdenum-cofactor synthesis protein NifE
VRPLLDELGIRILACISGDAKYSEVAQRTGRGRR